MTWLRIAAVNGFLAVAAGAFAAHGLKNIITPEMLTIFETGARYHMYHALALLAVSWLSSIRPGAAAAWSGRLFLVGIVLFSGSLYAYALTGARVLAMITPIGGTAFLAGWACLLVAAGRVTDSHGGEEPR